MIEKISYYLAKKIITAQNGNWSENEYHNVIQYGIECIINTAIPITIYVIYALINKIFLSMCVWLVTFLLLRNLIGGYHASTHIKCIISSSIYGLLFLHIIKYTANINSIYIITIYLIIILIHLIFNPIIHHEEDKNQQYIKSTRLKIILLLCITFIFAMIFNVFFQTISLALLMGTISAEILFWIGKISTP